jgi:hypothetical protein
MKIPPKLLLIKAASIPEGARWITVHPGGSGKGQPVLIQPHPDGSARVIGGAGGKLNYLKLRSVKSASEYKNEAVDRKKLLREERARQNDADKQSGLADKKKAARSEIKAKKQAAEQHVIRAVAQKAGWDKADLEFPEADYAHLSEAAQAKLRDKHHSALLSRAKEVIKQSRERLVSDPKARAEAGIGEVPLFSTHDDTLSVQDLDPLPETKARLGFNADYKGRAETNASPQGLKAEVDAAKQAKLATMTDAQRKAAFSRGEAAALIKQELEGIKEPAAPKADASLLSAKDALDLLKEGKMLAQIEKAARAANADVDKAKSEPKAFVIEASDTDVDAKVAADLENDLRTIQTSAFLSEVHRIAGASPEETLGGHIGVGAYNSINSLALAVGGEALVDRSVVDVLGIAGAAQILARRIHSDLSPEEAAHVTNGVQDFHLNHYMQTSTEALKKARDLTEAAKAIELSEEAKTGTDLAVAQELNARRRACVGDAQRILGQALGEMEANAALVVALKQGAQNKVQVSLGKIAPDKAVQQILAIGLQKGDYELEHVAGDTFLTVNAQGMDRLAKPVNRDDINQVRRNLSIIRGEHDEDNWLPLGVANRPDMAMDVKPGVAERLAIPFEPGHDLTGHLQDYIGARTADGDAPADILADIQSADFATKAGNVAEYRSALDAIAPLKGSDGKMQRAEALGERFERYADAYVKKLGGDRSTINKQAFKVDQKSVDALHRALSETPEGVSAYKQIGELDHNDQRALRDFFTRHVAKDSPEAAQLKQDLAAHEASEPAKSSVDIFGDDAPNPFWSEWKSKRDQIAASVNNSSLNWSKYVDMMGGNAKAYEAIQDMVRSKIAKTFTDAHNKLNPASPLKLGKQVIRNNLSHLGAVDPDARAARAEKDKALIDSMRERVGGKYASGSVADKMAAQKEQQEAYSQSQMGFFSTEEAPTTKTDLGSDERHTLGHIAERQVAGMMGAVGKNFKPGQPTKLWNVSMSGKYVNQQRAIKLLAENKRIGLHFGAGSGKTNIMLGSFAQLHGEGKVKRAVMLVPSIVQGQFGGEALRLLEPGKFKWHIQPGASREERIAAYKDPETHFCVMTHQSFRDDMIHLGAKHAGISEPEMTDRLQSLDTAGRKAWAAEVMAKEGMNFDASFVDEAHDTLNRAGKENSSLSNVIESVGHNTPYHIYASGDPVKNDPSEIHSMLQKLDPERYGDRAEFMRRYGADTIASKQALKREMARYVFPATISPDVEAKRMVEKVELSGGQKQAIDDLQAHMTRAKLANKSGKVDLEAAKAISPGSFDGVPESDHEDIARNIQKSLGIIKSSAINRIINTHHDNAKVARAVEMVKERDGKQGVIFARNKASVEQYKKAMEAIGKRVVTITGSDSAKDKDAKRKLFNPEQGEAKADILIASDAGAVGMNLQSGQYLIQHDISATAKTHSQRAARIHRLGQKNNVELIDLMANHKEETRARERLMKKYDLKDMMADPIDGLDDTGVASFIKAQRNSANSVDLI